MNTRTAIALVLIAMMGMFLMGSVLIGGSGPSYETVQDEAVSLTQRDTLNFEGAGVTCADDGGTKTTCTIPGSGTATSTVKEDDGAVSAAITAFDFGTGFDVSEAPAGEANITWDITETTAVPNTRTVTAGTGLAGGGALSGNITLAIGGAYLLPTGCTNGQVAKYNTGTGLWDCGDDLSGGASSMMLDLADDGSNESTALGEIAVTGDTNSILSEPSADKLLIDLTKDWPKSDLADAATALAANGANCSAGQVAGGVDQSGAAESCLDPITETELDTEGELESQLTDATNVYTDNDGALDDDDITDDNIGDLNDVVITSVADNEVLAYDSGGNWINQTAAEAGLAAATHASQHASGGSDPLYVYPAFVWVYVGMPALETHKAIFNLPWNVTYVEAHCVLRVAPTTDAVIVQFQENGSDIFADGDRVSIAASSTEDTSGAPTDTTGTAGQNITLLIEQGDSAGKAEDLTCYLNVRVALNSS